MIYIILIFSYLVFSFLNFLKFITSVYLSKHFNFISVYDSLFSNLRGVYSIPTFNDFCRFKKYRCI